MKEKKDDHIYIAYERINGEVYLRASDLIKLNEQLDEIMPDIGFKESNKVLSTYLTSIDLAEQGMPYEGDFIGGEIDGGKDS